METLTRPVELNRDTAQTFDEIRAGADNPLYNATPAAAEELLNRFILPILDGSATCHRACYRRDKGIGFRHDQTDGHQGRIGRQSFTRPAIYYPGARPRDPEGSSPKPVPPGQSADAGMRWAETGSCSVQPRNADSFPPVPPRISKSKT